MSILAIENERSKSAETGFLYLAWTLFCVLFGAVYEYFSHDVFSYYMLYAFAFPLAGGVLPFFILAFTHCPLPGRISLNLYHSGISTLTVGSIFQGAIEIYGTTNRLVSVYWITGAGFTVLGFLSFLLKIGKEKKEIPGHTRCRRRMHDV